MSPGINVFHNGATLLTMAMLYKKKPKSLLPFLIEELVPAEILSNPALTRTGTKKTVKFPRDILSAVVGEYLNLTGTTRLSADMMNSFLVTFKFRSKS